MTKPKTLLWLLLFFTCTYLVIVAMRAAAGVGWTEHVEFSRAALLVSVVATCLLAWALCKR